MKSLVKKIQNYQMDGVCNPYTTNCSGDHESSYNIRLDNLERYLKRIIELKPRVAWIGEALGHRGGRRSGLPFSDDLRIARYNHTYSISSKVATRPPLIGEITAGVIWEQIELLEELPLLWNVFPFHPHGSNHESNRKPRISELKSTIDITKDIIRLSKVSTLIAVGRTAESWLQRLGYDPIYIRHPSYGGINQFREQIKAFYQ